MGLYLVPASGENINKTILNGVDISTAEKFLLPFNCNRLKELLGEKQDFHCWAMTEGTKSEFDKMYKGDTILFVEKGTGAFKYVADVLSTATSEELGNYLWTYVPYKPWKYIYFLENIQEINIAKKDLVVALGYSPNYQVPGAIRVKDSAVHAIKLKYGSIHNFLNTLNKPADTKKVEAIASKVKDNPKDLSFVSCGEFAPQEKISITKVSYERPETFERLILEIEILKNDSEHKERAHESLVESFYDLLGFDKHTDIKYRQGRVDIGISYQNRPIIVNEIKKDWHLSYKDKNVIKQGYGYAIENGARFVVVTNGDYYAIFDRSKGLDITSNLIGEFYLTKLNMNCLAVIEKFKKENLLKSIS